jgi:hypothetical protein
VQTIEMVNNDGGVLNPRVQLILDPLGTPGVTVTDRLIQVDTSVAQFANVSSHDANETDQYRRFRLSGEDLSASNPVLDSPPRRTVMTEPTVGQRFIVGRPPRITAFHVGDGLSAAGVPIRAWNADLSGDLVVTTDGNASIRGYGLGLVSSIRMVDNEGLPISPNTTSVSLPFPQGQLGNAGVTYNPDSAGNWDSILDLNSTIWSTDANLLHSSKAMSRRISITTPFGSYVTEDNSSDTFRFVGTPDLAGADINGTLAATFGGGGFNGIDSYDFNTTSPTIPNYLNVNNAGTWQDLVINGNNFYSVNAIHFSRSGAPHTGGLYDHNMTALDPRNPPAGVTITPTEIRFTGAYIWQNTGAWKDAGTGRYINLRTAIKDDNATSTWTRGLTIAPDWNDENITP